MKFVFIFAFLLRSRGIPATFVIHTAGFPRNPRGPRHPHFRAALHRTVGNTKIVRGRPESPRIAVREKNRPHAARPSATLADETEIREACAQRKKQRKSWPEYTAETI